MSVGKSNRQRFWPVFLIVVAAVGMSNLDLFIVNVALPSIGRSVVGGSSLAGLSWVLNGYAIAFAALLIVGGRLGDRTGQRGLFLGGATVFTLASAICAAAPNLAVLVAARAVQAAGAAALIPTSLALLIAAAPPERRAGAVRAWAAVGGLSAALGPVIGGLLVQLDWRWVFLVNLPIGAATVLCGLRVLVRTPVRAEPLPDVLGAPLLAVGVGALSAALVQAPTWGWTSTRTIGLLGLAALSFAAFALRSRRHAHPLIEFGLLRTPTFGASSAATFLFSIGFATMLLSNVLWLQDVWHYGPVLTGLAIAPGPAMVPLVALGSGRLIRRFGPGPVATVGNLVFGVGLLLRALVVHSGPNYLVDFLPSMLLTGTGVGLTLPTLLSAATTALPALRVATGSAIVNTGRQVASALGIAVLVTLLGTRTVGAAAPDVYRRAWLVSAAIMVVAAMASVAVRRPALAMGDQGAEHSPHIDGPDNELVTA